MRLTPDNTRTAQASSGRRKISVTAPVGWQSPFEAYQKLYVPNSFLLESVGGPMRIARYSIIGLAPHTIFRAKGSRIRIVDSDGERVVVGDPFKVLRQLCSEFEVRSSRPFCGGAVGYFGYDLGRFIEELPNLAVDDLNLPDAVWFFCGQFVVFDHARKTAEAIVFVDAGGSPGAAYREAEELIKRLISALGKPVPALRAGAGGRQTKWDSNFSKTLFTQAVREAKEYIMAGDIYQVNLSQRLVASTVSSPLAIYSILRDLNPSPFAGFFDFGDWHLVGCSPERLVKLDGQYAQTRPIAGTIRRGRSDLEDNRLRDQLTVDIKERAEHIMLVDLERNDLGRVCRFGSVKVDELAVTESYSHVTHIVSNVVGKLSSGRDGFDLVRASFPGGTITGCPKVRAMEIIEELEPVRRGPYTGSMGYIGFNGNLDLNIIIRTLVIKDGLAYVQAGAGIVADSDPEREYYETLYKAEALVQATTLAEERHGCLPT
ncbi:MAG: anthranilate synthase component I family protein [Actinomycetota bacterium]|nr:anthranilate synthase component I family protein [Actinomycetota bacterium]